MDKIKNLAQILSSLEMSANDKRQLINYLNDLNKEENQPSTEMDIRYKPNSSFMHIEANQYIELDLININDENFENKKNEIIEKINKGIDILCITTSVFNPNRYFKVYYTQITIGYYDNFTLLCYRLINDGNQDKQCIIETIQIDVNTKKINVIERNFYLARQLNLNVFIRDGAISTGITNFMEKFKVTEDNKIIITTEKLIENNMYPRFIPFANDIIEVHFVTDTFSYNIAFRYLYAIDYERYIFEGKVNNDKTITFEIDNSDRNQSVIDLTPFINYVNEL